VIGANRDYCPMLPSDLWFSTDFAGLEERKCVGDCRRQKPTWSQIGVFHPRPALVFDRYQDNSSPFAQDSGNTK
jgi:hypothetical protein